jgi:RNA polymerase sigma-70 factor (ECF subfamily)
VDAHATPPACEPETEAGLDEVTADILAHQGFLRSLARGMERCDAGVDDLVQETLLRAFRARDHFQTGTSLRAWLATILRRKFLTDNLTRRRRRTETHTDTGLVADAMLHRGHEPIRGSLDETYEAALERLDDPVRRAFDQLPEVFRECFVLHALAELSYEEIAQRMGVPVGTVMSRIHRARLRLRRAVYSSERDGRMLVRRAAV